LGPRGRNPALSGQGRKVCVNRVERLGHAQAYLAGGVRNWISPAGTILLEVRFSVMVRSLGLHRIEARSYWGLVARINLIRKVASLTLVHNLIRSRVLLRMAGVEL
jgi:hypothetical protein